MIELSLALSLALSKVRAKVGALASLIEWPAILEPIVRFLLNQVGDVPWEVLNLKLQELGYTSGDIANIKAVYSDIRYSPEYLNRVYESMVNIYVSQVTNKFTTGRMDYKQLIDAINSIPHLLLDVEVSKLGEISPVEVFRQEIGESKVIQSSFEFINASLLEGGYVRGELIVVGAPPSVGKTTFLIQEMAYMSRVGYKVLYVALGDMMKYDIIVRVASQVLKKRPSSNPEELESIWQSEIPEKIRERFYISISPAGVVTPDDLIHITEEIDPDVVAVDYDANLKIIGEQMYSAFSDVYDTLQKGIARGKRARVLFIASQTKVQYWDDDTLPISALAESSRKQAIADVIITIGRHPRALVPAGYISIVKARRGGTGRFPYRITEYGVIEPITDSLYRTLVGVRG